MVAHQDLVDPGGSHNGNYKHGRYTAEAISSRRWLRQFTRDVRALTERLRQPLRPRAPTVPVHDYLLIVDSFIFRERCPTSP